MCIVEGNVNVNHVGNENMKTMENEQIKDALREQIGSFSKKLFQGSYKELLKKL